MKTEHNFWLLYSLLAVAQMVICNYLQLSPYAVVTILPAIVFCIPLRIGTSFCMIAAFATGLAVDWLSEGIIGLNAAAILPVALARKQIIRSFFGEDMIARGDSFSFRKNGFQKVAIAQMISTSLFLIVYIILDGAGTRPLWFSMARFGISLSINMILALITTNILMPEDRK